VNDINRVILRGHVGADPELRHTTGGAVLCRLRVATSERWEQDGEQKERTEWHQVTAWQQLAERLAVLRKGQLVLVEGVLRHRSWDKDDGGKGYASEVQATAFLALSPASRRSTSAGQGSTKDTNNNNGQHADQPAEPTPNGPGDVGDYNTSAGDDIPF